MKKRASLLFLSFLICQLANAQLANFFSLWTNEQYATAASRYAYPQEYLGITYNHSLLFNELLKAPIENTKSKYSLYLNVPVSNQKQIVFEIKKVYVMHPDLNEVFSEIQTYRGQGINDPSAKLTLSISPIGLHIMITSQDGVFYYDPLNNFDTQNCILYEKKNFNRNTGFSCDTDDLIKEIRSFNNTTNILRTHGTQLRNYRLALSCTGEYAAFYGGTKAGALAGMVASVNRVNAVYSDELAVKLTLVPNDTLLIYTNASTDPFTNTNGSTMLGENITTCNNVIGSANYDIGHVFSTGGGGVAYLGVPCTANKAGGVTGSSSPVGDAFDIDYVAHEMGHQFGAQHTFNASTGSCSGNRTATTAYEPGSGITIMAYAGICTSTNNLAPNSIPYFHTKSFDQITTYITTGSGSTCPTTTNTGNTPPTVTPAALTYSIPFQTPFELTATGSDANGDALTYCWEEFDLGAAGNWNSPVGDAPIFRPFSPVSSTSRTFPKISDIVNNVTTIGELLPSYARTLKFRITVRDNRIGGGGVMHPEDTVKVNVINTTTAFAVTSPNTNVTWNTGQSALVTWNVSNTTASPISCANVAILLSTDGGFTYPITILSSTPNDGTETITVPAYLSTIARIKVQSIGNIFFDISNTNFTIAAGSTVLSTLNTSALTTTTYCSGSTLNVSYSGDGPANTGNNFTVQLSNAAGSFASPISIGSLSSTANTGSISCTIPSNTPAGNGYRIRVIASNPSIIGTDNGANISIQNSITTSGIISGPTTICQGQTNVSYTCTAVTNATTYNWSLPTGFTITAGANTNAITCTIAANAISVNISVSTSNICGNGPTSSNYAVTVNALPLTPSSITGTIALCQGDKNINYSISTIANATSYLWTAPSGVQIISGNTTNIILTNFSDTAQSGTITVQGVNGCGNGASASLSVNVSSAPITPVIAASGSTTSCSNQGVQLNFTAQPGYNYQWRLNGNNISGATGNTYIATTTGSYNVVASFTPIGAQTFNSTSTTFITDNSCTAATNTISVSGYNGTIRSSGIYVKMNITHTWVGDLDIYLQAPDGTRTGLSDQTGNTNNSGDNFTNTIFADSGTAILGTTGAPYTGLYKPWNATFTVTGCTNVTSATTFASLGSGQLNPNGNWSLVAFDRAATDTGRIQNWSISFPYAGSNCTKLSNSINVSITNSPTITSITPTTIPVGGTITITGTNLANTSSVTINGGTISNYTINSPTSITATIPAGATSGPLSVVTPCGAANSGTITITNFLTLNIAAYIEGFYNNGGTLNAVSSANESDTIRIELREAVSPFALVHTVTTTLDTSGNSTTTIPATLLGNSYYIVFRHRNSLETWSKNPVVIQQTNYFSFK